MKYALTTHLSFKAIKLIVLEIYVYHENTCVVFIPSDFVITTWVIAKIPLPHSASDSDTE